MLEAAAHALGDLLAEVVFVGGATIGLWITDPAAPAPRPTKDVDLIVEVASRGGFYEFEERLRVRGLREDAQSDVICRWRYDELILDVMPTDASILGFANRWQALAVPHAITRELPSGARIAAVSPPFLVATKLEAFAGRGCEDYLASRDFADIVSLLDGRAELVDEVRSSSSDLRGYLAEELERHRRHPRFLDGIYGGLLPDDASQARAELIVVPRIEAIIAA
jgi:nucleotidyltransferase AbiEii toxin of type IV toxin-antitoxin system